MTAIWLALLSELLVAYSSANLSLLAIDNMLKKSTQAKLGRTGVLDMSGYDLKSFSDLEIPDITKVVDVSGNRIIDFAGFEPPATVDTLIMDDTPILSFLHFPDGHKIRHFSAKGTYLSTLPFYRSLVILALGINMVKTIDGILVTASDTSILTAPHILDVFKRNSTGVPAAVLVNKLGEAVRRGWISDTFPSSPDAAFQRAIDTEADPASVRAFRLHGLLRTDDVAIGKFMLELLGPLQEKTRVMKSDNSTRLEEQQTLIIQMQEELEALKRRNEQEACAQQKSKNNTTVTEVDAELSRESETAYEQLVRDVGARLIVNSTKVKSYDDLDNRSIHQSDATNPDGIRKAIMRLVGKDGASDQELLDAMRKHVKEAPSP